MVIVVVAVTLARDLTLSDSLDLYLRTLILTAHINGGCSILGTAGSRCWEGPRPRPQQKHISCLQVKYEAPLNVVLNLRTGLACTWDNGLLACPLARVAMLGPATTL